MSDPIEFLRQSAAYRDRISVPRHYLAMAKDPGAGIMLSQIVYWFEPGRDGRPRASFEKEGRLWIVKRWQDWWEECCLSEHQARVCCKLLEDLGLVERRVWKSALFGGNPAVHLSINWEAFLNLFDSVLSILSSPGNDDSVRTGCQDGHSLSNKESTTTGKDCAGKQLRPAAQDLVDFETWYRAYPRKVGRGDAAKAWRQTKKDRPSIAELLAALEIQAASSKWSDKTYIPHPASYLRALRWQDDLTLYQPAKTEPAPNPRLAAPVPIRDPVRKTRRLSGLVMAGPVGPLHENLTEDEWNARSAELGLGPWPEGEPE